MRKSRSYLFLPSLFSGVHELSGPPVLGLSITTPEATVGAGVGVGVGVIVVVVVVVVVDVAGSLEEGLFRLLFLSFSFRLVRLSVRVWTGISATAGAAGAAVAVAVVVVAVTGGFVDSFRG